MRSLALKPFAMYDREALAEALRKLAAANRRYLEPTFPHVVTRYSTSRRARRSVDGTIDVVAQRQGSFGAYAVTLGDQVVGVATYEFTQLQQARVTVHGPLVACWLACADTARQADERRLLNVVVRLAAEQILRDSPLVGQYTSEPYSTGRLFTFVSIAHPAFAYIDSTLQHDSVAVGCFSTLGVPAEYEMAGASGLHQLYVANDTLAAMREKR